MVTWYHGCKLVTKRRKRRYMYVSSRLMKLLHEGVSVEVELLSTVLYTKTRGYCRPEKLIGLAPDHTCSTSPVTPSLEFILRI